jgi:hypothetical protein
MRLNKTIVTELEALASSSHEMSLLRMMLWFSHCCWLLVVVSDHTIDLVRLAILDPCLATMAVAIHTTEDQCATMV